MGCIHICCGDGKGKTTAAVGLAVRMAGSGGRAVVARFLKNDGSGEVSALARIPGITVIPCRKTFGFTWQMTKEQKAEAAEYYRELLKEAFREAEGAVGELREAEGAPGAFRGIPDGETDAADGPPSGRPAVLLVLDEVCGAVGSGLLPEEDVLSFLDRRPEKLEVVLTGREPRDSFLCRADYVTEMKKLAHPFDRGMAARKGIEY